MYVGNGVNMEMRLSVSGWCQAVELETRSSAKCCCFAISSNAMLKGFNVDSICVGCIPWILKFPEFSKKYCF